MRKEVEKAEGKKENKSFVMKEIFFLCREDREEKICLSISDFFSTVPLKFKINLFSTFYRVTFEISD